MTEPAEGIWHDEPVEAQERDTLFTLQAGAFLDVVEGRGSPLCTLEEGDQTLRVNLAILESAAARRWQTISGANASHE